MMLKNNYIPILKQWVKGLINLNIDLSIVDTHFYKEDGMSLAEYLQYEQEQFTSLSHIYDLTEQFEIKIIAEQVLEQQLNSPHNNQMTKVLIYYYLINHLNKIVCKMTTTLLVNISDSNSNSITMKITGNNYSCQLVPKYNINYDLHNKNSFIKGLSLAIKIEKDVQLENIICPNLTVESLGKGANFTQDHFYHARFSLHEDEEFKPNQYYQFYLNFKKGNQSIIEKRKIFFDIIENTLIPFEVDREQLMIIDAHYPVHLTYASVKGKDNNHSQQNIEYPRNQTINLKESQNIIITDCLDNDWNIVQ